jgi:hypothetical protein
MLSSTRIADLDSLTDTEIEQDGKRFTVTVRPALRWMRYILPYAGKRNNLGSRAVCGGRASSSPGTGDPAVRMSPPSEIKGLMGCTIEA